MELDAILKDYCSAWCEADTARRDAFLERAWAENGVYRDPTAEVSGRAELSALIGGLHTKMPGVTLEQTTGVSQHHNCIYFGWRVVLASGDVLVEGVDFGELAPDGRIARITGFFGPPGA